MRASKQSHQSVKQTWVSPITEDTNPGAFFKAVYQAFQRAEQATGGSIDRFYRIDRRTIRLRFAGPALVPFMTPAFEHLAVKPEPIPALTICLWDSASAHTKIPPSPWQVDDYVARGEMWRFNNERFNIVFLPANGTLNMLDRAENLAIYWIHDAHRLPWYETGSPLQAILNWWTESQGYHLVHAGAVGMAEGGVLLAGKAGSGKSTTALTCLNSKLAYVSDDLCLISNHPFPYAYSLYSSGKISIEDIQRFPLLKPALSNTIHLDEKALYLIYEHRREKMSTGFPIRAVLIPQVTGRMETTLTSASPVEGLKALAPSTIFQLQLQGATRSASTFRAMAELVKKIPCYHLALGTDLSQIPEVILSLLSEV